MPYAVTHVILTIVIIDLFRDYILKDKKLISLHTIFIGGVAGLLPDIDIPIGWIFGNLGIYVTHGGVTHTLLFGLLFIIPAFIFLAKGNKKNAFLYFIIAFGVIFHLFLDWFLGGGMGEGVMWLFPFFMHTSKLHLLHIPGLSNLAVGLDAIILLFWLWHEEVKHKIIDFI